QSSRLAADAKSSLIPPRDDGIVVGEESVMARVPIGLALRDRLGDNGVRDLETYIEQHEENRRTGVVNQITERLGFRIKECAKRDDVIDGFARIGNQMSDNKVELLRWSFAFWIGQVTVIFMLLSYMLKK
ncbi:MAG TPA: hypothetical protein VM096_08550, partial [Vicinamibacterales bacterium]|nr:hypothetical protein [Vicinamibacterales bacterium]